MPLGRNREVRVYVRRSPRWLVTRVKGERIPVANKFRALSRVRRIRARGLSSVQRGGRPQYTLMIEISLLAWPTKMRHIQMLTSIRVSKIASEIANKRLVIPRTAAPMVTRIARPSDVRRAAYNAPYWKTPAWSTVCLGISKKKTIDDIFEYHFWERKKKKDIPSIHQYPASRFTFSSVYPDEWSIVVCPV